MARLSVHYEAAFEDFLRSRAWPYVPVDEGRKAIFAGGHVKSFDFLVYPPDQTAWIADLKGRKFPYEGPGGRRFWENWVTREDIEGLTQWQKVFGAGFEGVFVFAYWLTDDSLPPPSANVHPYRNARYAFFWVTVGQYAAHARARSPKWETVTLPTKDLRRLLRPAYGT